ncbi:MAG TPA: hypothetical protein VH280_21165 [Verrucomicrobiae bacterium]|nr:hypothetical protein [Verrucomicrobiae bacterium]
MPWLPFRDQGQTGHGNCYGHAMTRGSQDNAAELKDLEMQVQKARQLVRESELKVEAIEASIHEVEKFHPRIKILRRPAAERMADNGFSLFAENLISR